MSGWFHRKAPVTSSPADAGDDPASAEEGSFDISEDVEPMEGEFTFHDVPPEAEDAPVVVDPHAPQPLSHPDKMRRAFVFSLIAILVVTVGGGFYGWIKEDDLSAWTSFTTPVFTLAGVALTFYFTRKDS